MEISEEVAKEEFGLSEEDIKELTDSSNAVEPTQEEELEAEQQEKSVSKHEAEALDLGWVNQDEWVKKGKDPEDWKPAKAFLEVNKLHKSIDEKLSKIERKHQEDIKGLNKFHELQLLDTIKKLTQAREDAVTVGDVEAFKQIDAQLEQFKQQTPPPVNDKPVAIQEWESNNKWCEDPNDERTILANALFKATVSINPNMSINDRLKYVDDNLALKFPKQNARREVPASTERSTKTHTKQTYSMSDLTQGEREQWNKFGKQFYDNQEQFIKAAIAARTK